MDRIIIQDLLARCVLGVSDEERRERQDVLITLELVADLRSAGTSDRLEDAIDYRSINKQIFQAAESSHYHLAEALAEDLAAVCLADPRIRQVMVRVEKPSALRFARSVAVEITRKRED